MTSHVTIPDSMMSLFSPQPTPEGSSSLATRSAPAAPAFHIYEESQSAAAAAPQHAG